MYVQATHIKYLRLQQSECLQLLRQFHFYLSSLVIVFYFSYYCLNDKFKEGIIEVKIFYITIEYNVATSSGSRNQSEFSRKS